MVVGSLGRRTNRVAVGFEINAARTSSPAAFLLCPSIPEDTPAMVVGYQRGESLKKEVVERWRKVM
jgi:hypothetical protein